MAEVLKFDFPVIRQIPQMSIRAAEQSCRKGREAQGLPPGIQQGLHYRQKIGGLLGGHHVIPCGPHGGNPECLEGILDGYGLPGIAHEHGEVRGSDFL